MRGRPSSNPALTRFVDLQGSRDVPLEPQSSSLFSLLPTLPAQERDWRLVAAGLILVSLLTMAGFWIEPIIKGPNLAILYMLAVVFVALWWGKWAAILSAISGAFLFDYFFVPSLHGFGPNDIWYLITLLGLLSVGLLVSMLTLAAREEAAAARIREAQTAELYSLTKALASESHLEQMLPVIDQHLAGMFASHALVWMPGDAGLTIRFGSQQVTPNDTDRAVAEWVFKNGEPAGCGTENLSFSRINCFPLKTWKGPVGVLGILVNNVTDWLAPQRRQLLETFANTSALAITRAVLAKEGQRAEVLQEADKLHKALLNSISHNLRTPLASVTGVLNSLLEDGPFLDASTQKELLATAQEEASRLNRVLQNLLDMTRLEGGVVHVKTELHDIQDAVGAALEQIAGIVRQREIVVSIPPGMPLVPMDFVLIVQVLVNLLDNALKYSPAGKPIEVEAALDGNQVQIRVRDRGEGIPDVDLERVFDKFFRGAAAETPGGAGLGLSICKGLIEAHGGRIWVQRRAQGGTEAIFSLPLGSNR